jgi:hypothetical protein
VVSPKRLGPAAQFAPVAIEDASGDVAPQASAGPDARKPVQAARIRSAKAAARMEKPRGAARVKLAKHHGNPLDAQAFDTRVQVWPCKSGGICNWQRQ